MPDIPSDRAAAVGPPAWVAGLLLLVLASLPFAASFVRDELLVAENDFYVHCAILARTAEQTFSGTWPLWNPYECCGQPLAAFPYACAFYPPALLFGLLSPAHASSLFYAFHLLLGGTAILLLVRESGGSRGAALLAAVALMLGGWYVSRRFCGAMEHFRSTPYVHLFLAAFLRSWRLGRRGPDAAATVAFSLLLLQGCDMAILQAFYLAVALVAFHPRPPGAERSRVRQAGVLALAVACAVALSAVQVLPFAELLLESSRLSADNPMLGIEKSLSPHYLLGLFAPDLFGNPVTGSGYWGSVPFSHFWFYVGALPFLLSVAGLRRAVSCRHVLFWTTAGAVSILMVMGEFTPFHGITCRLLPLVSLVRLPQKYMLTFFTAFTLIGAAGFDSLMSSEDMRLALLRCARAAAIVFILLVLFLGSESAREIPLSYFQLGKVHHFLPARAGLAWSALFCALAAAALRVSLVRSRLFPVLALVLVIADLLPVALRFSQTRPTGDYLDTKKPLVVLLRESLGPGERIGIAGGQGWCDQDYALQGLPAITSYNSLVSKRTTLFFKAGRGDTAPDFRGDIRDLRVTPGDTRLAALSVTRLVVHGDARESRTPSVPAGTGTFVSTLPPPLPFAFEIPFSGVISARDAGEALGILGSPGFDPGTSVVWESPVAFREEDSGAIRAAAWKRLSPRNIEILVERDEGLLVVNESYHPGWRARVDGAPVAVQPANLNFCGIPVRGRGPHRVELEYLPSSFVAGACLSLASWTLGLGAVLLQAALKRRARSR